METKEAATAGWAKLTVAEAAAIAAEIRHEALGDALAAIREPPVPAWQDGPLSWSKRGEADAQAIRRLMAREG